MHCFRCNQSGHMMNTCPELTELLTKGIVTKDEAGRIMMMDGTRICQEDGESIVAAVEQMKPSVNFISYSLGADKADKTGDKSDDEGDKMGVYPVLHSQKIAGTKRREILDGVYPPPRPTWKR
ncbi:hypothetical protein JAAARDRAFT_116940, partial [Jaapia argillacea MUCL 33604]